MVGAGGAELAAALGGAGLEVRVVESRRGALEALEERPSDVALVQIDAPGGLEVIAAIARLWPDVGVIAAAAGGGVAEAVEAMRAGADDFVDTGAGPDAIARAIRCALHAEDGPLVRTPDPSPDDQGLLGATRAMQGVRTLVRRAAAGTATVLVRGESGTGKELVARAVHALSARAAGPFVKVHCAALPETLLESELFGYEKGAFTGATARKPGRVEIAQGGTLFLDEIGDITPAVQVKLLRLVQDRELERLGGTATVKVDVRFVAATHRDLEAMIKKGEFREDLFYRLNVVPIWTPPLRARRDDVELLARRFCEAFTASYGKPRLALDDEAVALLRAERWPGNVRQLQNIVERLVALHEGESIGAEDVRRELADTERFTTEAPGAHLREAAAPRGEAVIPLGEEVRLAERRAIVHALEHTKGNRALAARLLGVSRATLYNKLEEHGVS